LIEKVVTLYGKMPYLRKVVGPELLSKQKRTVNLLLRDDDFSIKRWTSQ
jgi:hypothetical protein